MFPFIRVDTASFLNQSRAIPVKYFPNPGKREHFARKPGAQTVDPVERTGKPIQQVGKPLGLSARKPSPLPRHRQ